MFAGWLRGRFGCLLSLHRAGMPEWRFESLPLALMNSPRTCTAGRAYDRMPPYFADKSPCDESDDGDDEWSAGEDERDSVAVRLLGSVTAGIVFSYCEVLAIVRPWRASGSCWWRLPSLVRSSGLLDPNLPPDGTPRQHATYETLHTASLAVSALRGGLTTASAASAAPALRRCSARPR